MIKKSKKLIATIIIMTLTLSLVSCANNSSSDNTQDSTKINVEMPYATSAEDTVAESFEFALEAYDLDAEYTNSDNVITITTDEADLEKAKTKIQEEKEYFDAYYPKNGYINSVEVNDTYKEITIDFTANITEDKILEVYNEYTGLSMLYQCFNKVSADDFSLNLILAVDGQLVAEETITKESMIDA